MTDKLRTAAQACLEKWDKTGYLDTTSPSYRLMNALRDALAEPSPIDEAIAHYESEGCNFWEDESKLINMALRYAQVAEPSQLHCLAYVLAMKLQNKQNTIDALIAEIDGLGGYDFDNRGIEWCDGKYNPDYYCSNNVKAILDKYRSEA